MIREKFIFTALILISSLVIIQSIVALSTVHHSFLDNVQEEEKNLEDIIDEKNNPLAPLQTNSWGEDIFYDRSNIYNRWFELTGITQFEGGYKAIINGEIVNEYKQVRGFQVIEITENQVVLERDQYNVKLKLDK